ncbi:hypothetical protein SEMRO_1239_G255300.1 [Seminavis robusta]|uniref:Uncharacterized protein n=1 Tax=Seminavis robusta TaxID=568900 RepID=A0A9N8HR79_9STRA|nr:hypothetical protein SEMRO_1239_G255300.1 [Seminavis robusta]|eukprot:Sro1239_g255300.1 n/a (136) ;mRNA; f:11282-11689
MHHTFVKPFDGAKEEAQLLTRLKFRPKEWRKAHKNQDWSVFKEPLTLEHGPAHLEPPGIPDIKWQELYDKWRKLIPLDKRTIKWFKEDPGVERRAKVQANSKKAKATRRQRTATKVSAAEAATMATAPTEVNNSI